MPSTLALVSLAVFPLACFWKNSLTEQLTEGQIRGEILLFIAVLG